MLIENNLPGSISPVMGDRKLESDESKKTLYIDANSLYGGAMSLSILYDEIKFNEYVKLEHI